MKHFVENIFLDDLLVAKEDVTERIEQLVAEKLNQLLDKTFEELLILSPSSPGFHFQMATVFTQLEQYDKAEKEMLIALKFCPSCNTYWSKLGDDTASPLIPSPSCTATI